MSWRERAACVGMDPDRFVIDEGPYKVPREHRQGMAAALCTGCPVRAQCAADALTHRDLGVVRGGVWLDPRGVTTSPEDARHLAAVANERGLCWPQT